MAEGGGGGRPSNLHASTHPHREFGRRWDSGVRAPSGWSCRHLWHSRTTPRNAKTRATREGTGRRRGRRSRSRGEGGGARRGGRGSTSSSSSGRSHRKRAPLEGMEPDAGQPPPQPTRPCPPTRAERSPHTRLVCISAQDAWTRRVLSFWMMMMVMMKMAHRCDHFLRNSFYEL